MSRKAALRTNGDVWNLNSGSTDGRKAASGFIKRTSIGFCSSIGQLSISTREAVF
jgi:hypothetical protein